LQLVDSWRWMLGIMVVPSILFSVLLFSIPESPRWLILEGNDQAAIPILKRLGELDLSGAVASIRDSVKEHQERLFQRRYSKPIVCAILLAMFNQLAGINGILYYAPRIFQMAGYDQSQSFSQSIFIGVANLVSTLLAMSVIDKFGRKTLLMIGSIGMIVFLSLVASTFAGNAGGSNHLLLYLIGFIVFFAFSQGAVIWVFIAEIFPNSVRSKGGSLGSTTHWVMAAIITTVFPAILEKSNGDVNMAGGQWSFTFFAVMMVLQLVFIWRVMPETKGKSLEQIQKDLGIA
jgi:sugar porter (SP) family MFS transporter